MATKVLIFGNDEHVNICDDNNSFVGYSLLDDCCANGDWFISSQIHNKLPEPYDHLKEKRDFPEYNLDPDFFKEVEPDGESYDSDYGCVVFRLIPDWRNEGKLPFLYLHLFNVHNGYYAKGFKSLLHNTVKDGSV